MQIKAISCFLLVLFFCSCSVGRKDQMPPAKQFSRLQTDQTQALNDIKLINARTFVRRGESGSITIQGLPGATYTITSAYKLGEKLMTAYESRVADNDGRVTWSWTISNQTAPGAYPITITGGGKTFVTSYTVNQ